MKEYTVPNPYSYEEAMWLSKPGDTIRITSGDYLVLPTKAGVNITFEKGKITCGSIWAGIGGGGDSTISGATINGLNIKTWFSFIKLLPFELRLKVSTGENHPLPFCTPEGCILEFLGNKSITPEEGMVMGPPQYLGDGYHARRPKALIRIRIPSDLDINFSILNQSEKDSAEAEAAFARMDEENKIHFAIDGSYGLGKQQPYFLPCGDIMYLALWTLNRFLRSYGKIAKADKLTREGLSLSQFKDGIDIAVVNAQDTQQIYSRSGSFVESFQSTTITEEDICKIQKRMVSAPDYTLQENIEFFLDRLHYHLATISIQQALEISLDNFLNGKGDYKFNSDGILTNKKGHKLSIRHKCFDTTYVKSIIAFTNDQVKYLCELIEARNNITHSGHCKVDANSKSKNRCASIQPFSEYKIYREKRPWYWYYEGVLPLLEKLK